MAQVHLDTRAGATLYQVVSAFESLLAAHGSPVIGRARALYRPTVEAYAAGR